MRGRIGPFPAFGGGLTWCSHVIRWGERVTPRDESDIVLPPCDRTALQIVQGYIAAKHPAARSNAGLTSPTFVESAAKLS